MSNKSVVTYEAGNPCEITPGDLTYNGTTYDITAASGIPKSLATAANQGLYSTAPATWSVFSLTSIWRTFLGTVKAAWNEATGVFKSYGIQIDTAPAVTPTGAPGLIVWDDTLGTLEFQAKGGNVTVHIGEIEIVRVKNNDAIAFAAGNVVYISGSNGTNLLAKLANAGSEATSASTIGIVAETIAPNNHGFVTTFGLVQNINTNHLIEGGPVWLSTVSGQTTATRPTQPNHGVMLGFCLRKQLVNGSIFVRVDNGWELDELHNVLISTPTNGQVLAYDSAVSLWKNQTLGSASTYAATAFAQTANNLSDLASAATARTNLGLGTAATQNSTAFATAAQGTLASTAVQRVGDSMTGNLSITLAQNASTGFATTNTNTGTSAQANLACTSDGGTFYFGAASNASAFSGGGFLYTNANVPLTLWTWNTKRMTIPGNGDATLHTGLAVQGVLSTTGDITLTKNAAGSSTIGITNTNATGQPQFSATSNGGTFYFGAGYTGGSFGGGGFLYTASAVPISLWTNNTKRMEITGTGNVGVGGVAPTARLMLPAGTASANTAPFKFTSGTNLATPEAGAMEYDGTSLYFTNGAATRYNLTSPSVWSFDSTYNSGGTGTSQYITLIQLAVNDVYEIEVNLRVAETSNNLTAEMAQIKARCTVRRPGTATFATQFVNATTDKQTTTNVAAFAAFIEEDATTKGLIKLRIAGVAGYTLVGRAFGWIK